LCGPGGIGNLIISAFLAMIAGAISGALRRRHTSGAVPGALLALALLAAGLGRMPGCNESTGLWHWVRILAAGVVQAALVGAAPRNVAGTRARLVGAAERNFFDLPLDFRFVAAASIGALLRGAAYIVNGLMQ